MKRFLTTAVLLLLAGAAAALFAAAAPALKCAPLGPDVFPGAPDFVYILDGRTASEDILKKVDVSQVESVEVACALDIHRVFGIESRRGGVVMFTAPGPQTAVRSALDSIVSLQRRHFEARGVFAARLADLQWSDATGMITVEMSVSHEGKRWSATGRHRHFVRPQYAITVSGDRTFLPQ